MKALTEHWLATQQRQLEEVRRLMDRLEGSLRVAVRVPGVSLSQLGEADMLAESIEHEMKALRTRITAVLREES